ncbi:uncharacterized protein LOC9633825 isoform X1 [Selaginella moellendorffii]|uniref:uncharacterized protein LOC9633825 isoform X1 n=1 Tax=Selaginella moellendorffii TaxID=88036 RepID=UPI000D1C3AE9|nr:uncharacterized protein LOC9633825 isoform X1 [Selaginella moellendorffii]XP_024540075.1 uncharacterized protein LOC9633825 isoform X1 [Selaginella moellendorffii]|eukprot:XP_024540074.1 uncharacterized protein LOC9633825 isoform X1 [Selaginella moellendorffii]
MDRRFSEYTGHGAAASVSSSDPSSTAVPLQLFVRQEIPGASNPGPYIADCLPDFAGYSWIAYGAGSQLVISIVASPDKKEEFGIARLFHQALETRLVEVSDEDSRVSIVSWGNSQSGSVGAAAGKAIYIFAPRFLGRPETQNTPALPLEWEPRSMLVHTFPVTHFSWSGSGDGILSSAGSKISMWKQDDDGSGNWVPVWESLVEWPQALVAASWSYRGLAASTDMDNLAGKDLRGKATVWWWQEGSEAQPVELSHPRQVLAIQWRPVSRQNGKVVEESDHHRLILLTSCRDGVVRLWLEIDSGKARADNAMIKPAFFVSALIEVNTSLQATLGLDCFVTWGLEKSQGSNFATGNSTEVAACEWIVGTGPRGIVALWSLHCLDDVYPPRCPRVLLWQQGTLRLLDSEPDIAENPCFFKAVIQRAQSSVPPTSVDLFEVYDGGLLRRSRLWPPVTSIGGGSGLVRRASDTTGLTSKIKIGTWGRSHEDFLTFGHTGNKINLALHPARAARVAASVDKAGTLLLWQTSLPLEPYVEAPHLHVSSWRLCGRLSIQTENFLPALCWSPALLLGDKMVLVVSHSDSLSCYLVVRDRSKEQHWLALDLLYELRPPVSQEKLVLEDVFVIQNSAQKDQSVLVLVACGNKGNVAMSWTFNIVLCEKDGEEDQQNSRQSGIPYKGPLVGAEEAIYTTCFWTGYMFMALGERLLSATSHYPSLYNFVSGCEDGSLRLWRVTLPENQHLNSWECVGRLTTISSERFTLLAVGNHGTKLASSTQSDSTLRIWEIVCGSGSYLHYLTGEIVLAQTPAALSWFEGGDGVSMLGIVVAGLVQVYVEARDDASDYSSWVCLASISTLHCVDGLFWGPQASLVVTTESRIQLLSQWGTESGGTVEMLLKAAITASRPRSLCHPKSILNFLLNGEQHQASICLRRLLSLAAERTCDSLEFPFISIHDIQKEKKLEHTAVTQTAAWVFGESMEHSDSLHDVDGPLSALELEQLTSIVELFKNGSQLLPVIHLLQGIRQSSQFAYLDEPGQRVAISVLYNKLQNLEVLVDSKTIAWALQSECKDLLVDMLIPENSMSWSALRALGVGFWFTDVGQLRARIEKLARTLFMQSRDPKDCALFYIALDRKTVLSGLFKMSRDESDKPLVQFFARDFQDDKNKSAALKNAYVLMGKHRHELAATFFLLGGDLESAISVCTRNLCDPQLALVICRLKGSNEQPAKDLISKDLLPDAKISDKWLASVFQYLLGERLEALCEIVGSDKDPRKLPLLDPDVGDYCRVVLSKPGMTSSSIANKACRISALALKKLGLPLRALEILQRSSHETFSAGQMDWIVPAVAEKLAVHFVEGLALQYMIDAGEIWRDFKQKTADNGVRDLAILNRKFSIDLASLSNLLELTAWHLGRPWFGYWLLNTATISTDLPSPFSSSANYKETILEFVSSTEIFCATLLAFGPAIFPSSISLDTYGNFQPLLMNEGHIGLATDKAWSTTLPQVEELRSYASQINQFVSSSSSIPDETERRHLFLLAFIFLMGAAWLKRQAEVLLFIIQMMLDTETTSGLDLNACFRMEPSKTPFDGSETKLLSDDDTWLLLGVALWSRVLTFLKRQLSTVATEVSYSGFGRVSPRQSTIKSFSRLSFVSVAEQSVKPRRQPGAEALLSSIGCIFSKLRTQLALRVRDTANGASLDFLWKEGPDAGNYIQNSYVELWKLLSVNEEVRAALKMEGIDGQQPLESKVGWIAETSDRSSASAVPAPEESGIRSQLSRRFSMKGLIRSHFNTRFRKDDEALHSPGDSLEAISVNSCNPEQVVVASSSKGLLYLELNTYGKFSESKDNLWAEADWPQDGWAGSVSTPVPTFVTPGVGLGSKSGSGIGLGGAAVGMAALSKSVKESRKAAVGFGVPGYAGIAAWHMGWEELADYDGLVDPPATVENVTTSAIAAHPLRPFFLVGARNTHVYLWKFGESSATATYGVLPAANVPPPYALASVSSVQFDRCGHRFASSAVDGTVCAWQLEVGGRSNVCPTESQLCFDRHAWDVTFVGESGAIIAAAGSSPSGENLVVWNTLAPPSSARMSISCHEGGANCLDVLHADLGGSPLIITGGKKGDISVHDFRYITTGKAKRRKNGYQRTGDDGRFVWHIPKAHTASVTRVRAVPGTTLFLTGSKDGDVKLWDVNKCELVKHWQRVHEKRLFLQHNTPGLGALVQAAVMDLRILPNGFITCGSDGALRHFRLESEHHSG